MAPLHLRLFGPLRAHCSETGSETVFSGRTAELLAYLGLFRSRRHARVRLAGVLWGDLTDRKARRCLSTTLWRLRSDLEVMLPAGAAVFHAGRHEVAFHPGTAVQLDVAAFEEATLPVAAGTPPATLEAAAAVERSLALYEADLLDGMFHDWVLRERRRLRGLRLSAFVALMRFHKERAELGDAIRWGQELLVAEPYNEAIVREMMRLHVTAGQRGLALELYERTTHVLEEELEEGPTDETRSLYARIRGGAAPRVHEPPAPPLSGLVRRLRTAARDLEAARSHVRRAVEEMEHGSNPRWPPRPGGPA